MIDVIVSHEHEADLLPKVLLRIGHGEGNLWQLGGEVSHRLDAWSFAHGEIDVPFFNIGVEGVVLGSPVPVSPVDPVGSSVLHDPFRLLDSEPEESLELLLVFLSTDHPEVADRIKRNLAEYYSADLAQKVKRGMTENVLEGKITGGRIPFGYKKEGQKYVIDAERASIVRELFNQYANTTITCKGLAEYVNSKGFLNGDGKPFKDATIYNMLRNEKYMGILRFGETVNTKGAPQIVDEVTFKIVQEKMALEKSFIML